jgi:hypothetical protein
MRSLLDGLEHNATLKTLDMAYCETDHQGVTLLAQALVGNKTIPVEHIALLYLKLNRFGRRGLHAANLLRLALWLPFWLPWRPKPRIRMPCFSIFESIL